MKAVILLALVVSSSSFAAGKLPSYLEECNQAALKKLSLAAQAKVAVLLPSSLKVKAINDRLTNPVKYVWYDATAVRSNGDRIPLRTMTQKSFWPRKPCF